MACPSCCNKSTNSRSPCHSHPAARQKLDAVSPFHLSPLTPHLSPLHLFTSSPLTSHSSLLTSHPFTATGAHPTSETLTAARAAADPGAAVGVTLSRCEKGPEPVGESGPVRSH